MRTVAFAAGMVLALWSSASGQEARTLGDDGTGGLFVTPAVKFTELGDDVAILPGARIGWVAGHELSLGIGAWFSAGDASFRDDFGRPRDLRLDYGGFETEFIFFWDYTYHMTISVLLGGGRLGVDGEGETVGVVEPLANLQVNLLRGFRLDLGGGYRVVWGVDEPGISSSDAGGFVGAIGFRLGAF